MRTIQYEMYTSNQYKWLSFSFCKRWITKPNLYKQLWTENVLRECFDIVFYFFSPEIANSCLMDVESYAKKKKKKGITEDMLFFQTWSSLSSSWYSLLMLCIRSPTEYRQHALLFSFYLSLFLLCHILNVKAGIPCKMCQELQYIQPERNKL